MQPAKPVDASGAAGLFFSEYIEGSSNNKAIEIYNGTGAAINLQEYKVVLYANGSTTPVNTLTWTSETLIADGDVYVIANPSASAPIMDVADITSNVTFYNGDDAIALQKVTDGSFVDVIGQIGLDPGTSWGTEPITTVEHRLTRKETICEGDTNGSDAFDPAVEWDGYPQDTFTYLGSHTTNCFPPTVTVYAANVTDDDTEDPPDNMASDYSFTFNVAYGCGDPYTAISAIQGEGMSTPLSGQVVSTEGIVVADYQTNEYVSGTRNGFFMQSVTPDDDPDTSEGLFVYSYLVDVAVGDHVRVTGTASEYYDLTELSSVSQIQVCSGENGFTPTEFALPATDLLDFERLEGMLVTIPQDLVISEYYNFDRYGEIVLTTERFMTYTAVNEPSVDGFAAWQDALKLNSITLDDGRESQNPDPSIHPNGEEFTLENRFRGGDLVSAVTGVMDYEFNKYRIQPTQGANYTEANPRPETPELAPGFLKVASFNVLNYFTTIDTGAWICGPSGDMECRGADTADELNRQRAKILAALSGIDADIFGIIEIENDRPLGEGESSDYAVADLVAGLNDTFGEGTFAYIATGAIGTDAIKQAIIYKPAAVTPVGEFQLLTTDVDPRFIDTLNRPVLAQVFEDNFTGETFVVAVNHLKSKGSACPNDPDLLDGQGNCNLTRKAAAQALVDWLANPAYFPDVENALIIGDLNSYDHEDPIDMIKLGADDTAGTDDDYFDMMAEFRGEDAYGYVYDGQIGYLDYALTNASLAERIVDVNFWHINADEPDLIDYDMTFKQDAQDALYASDAYRSSDHDPVVISISFNAAPVAVSFEVELQENSSVTFDLLAYDVEDDPLTYNLVSGPARGTLNCAGVNCTYTPNPHWFGMDSFIFTANDGLLDSNEATVTLNVIPLPRIYLPIIFR